MNLTTTETPINGTESKTERELPFKTIFVEGPDGAGKTMFVNALAIAMADIYSERGIEFPPLYFLTPDTLDSGLEEWNGWNERWQEAKASQEEDLIAKTWLDTLENMYKFAVATRGPNGILIVMKSIVTSLAYPKPHSEEYDLVFQKTQDFDNLLHPDLIIQLRLDPEITLKRILGRGDVSNMDPTNIEEIRERAKRLERAVRRYYGRQGGISLLEFNLDEFDDPDYDPKLDTNKGKYWEVTTRIAETLKNELQKEEQILIDTRKQF